MRGVAGMDVPEAREAWGRGEREWKEREGLARRHQVHVRCLASLER